MNSNVSQPVENIIMQLLKRSPDNRPPSAAHVMDDLAPLSQSADLAKVAEQSLTRSKHESLSLETAALPIAANSSNDRGSNIRIWKWLCSAAAFGMILAGIVFTIETQKGQLVIDSDVAATLKIRSDNGRKKKSKSKPEPPALNCSLVNTKSHSTAPEIKSPSINRKSLSPAASRS